MAFGFAEVWHSGAGCPDVHLFSHLVHILNVRSMVRVGVDAHADQFPKLLRVVLPRERRVVTLLNLLAEGEEIHLISIEGALKSCHLQGKECKGSNTSLKV